MEKMKNLVTDKIKVIKVSTWPYYTTFRDPFYQHGLTLIPDRKSNFNDAKCQMELPIHSQIQLCNIWSKL